MFTHHSHASVQRAIQKLYQLDLVAITNYGKRTRVLKPVSWPDQAAWSEYKKLQGKTENDEAQDAPHITPSQEKTKSFLSRGVDSESPTTGDAIFPSNAGGLCGSVGGGSSETSAQKPQDDGADIMYQLRALQHRDKMLEAGWSRDKANRIALVKYPEAKFEDD